jgi:GNAT superfamily N-acetyltransferase
MIRHRIEIANTSDAIAACYPVMLELRPHLSQDAFIAQVLRQLSFDYTLVFLEAEDQIRSVAGYHISECLAWGKFLYIEDLVTRQVDASIGFGGLLFDWIVAQAQSWGCTQVHLDSGVQRFGAHRFYAKKRMSITSHHFSLDLNFSLDLK